jgi:hypothetical protein
LKVSPRDRQSGAVAWAMMLIGFADLGFAGYRTSRRAIAQAAA